MSTWQFVDSISASPTVRLDINSKANGLFLVAQPDMSPPGVRRVTVSSMLTDGDTIPAAAFTNRTLTLTLSIAQTSADNQANTLQSLARELARQPGNILRTFIGSNPMFFRTYPAPDAAFQIALSAPQNSHATIQIPCEPFGYGLEETLPPVTIYSDPNEGLTLNANPYFETDASNWTSTGGTFARTTTQFHEGAASGLLTPDGVSNSVFVESEEVPVVLGQSVRGSSWLKNAVSRSVQLRLDWYTPGHVFSSQTTLQTTTVAANTWTLFDGTAAAPIAGFVRLTPFMSGTPVSGTNLLYADEARLRFPGSSGALYFDMFTPKGDVETPLTLTFGGTIGTGGSGNAGQIRTAIAVRRRGTPANMPMVIQAEVMTQSTNTTTQANSTVMSGAGNNFSRCTFGTIGMVDRLTTTAKFPASPSTDARGTYRVYARSRQTVGTDVINMRLLWGSTATQIVNDTVTLPTDVGAGAPTIKFIDLGLVQIPVGYDPIYDGISNVELAAEGVFLDVQAQRVSGTGNLDIDFLLFVPTDDRSEIVQFPAIQNTPTDVFVVEGGSRPAAYCLNVSNQIVSTAPLQLSGIGALITPNRTNRIVVVQDVGSGNGSTSATGSGLDITSKLTVTPSYFPRYLFPLKPVST